MHEPVFVPWEGFVSAPQIPNSSFAAHSGNVILNDIMQEMSSRYKKIVDSGKYSDDNGYIGASTLKLEKNERAKILTSLVGPGVFTDVIMRHDSEVEPMLGQKRDTRFGVAPPQGFNEKMEMKMPLGRYIKPGSLGSWRAN
ncbi:hypothetical protein [Pseudomonas sp. 18173]|uniref:hypothetical protein n=1 Tax=Pseudomonas sp. 18173 TaxID=3390055 RepID=UPI003D1B8803